MYSILEIIFFVTVVVVSFKFGEILAYFKIAKGLTALKELEQQGTVKIEVKGAATVEKIGDQYYAYIGNDFVAQGKTVDEVHNAVNEVIRKNPSKFLASLKQQQEQI